MSANLKRLMPGQEKCVGLATSGVSPSDVVRQGTPKNGLPAVIPHAMVPGVDEVGAGVRSALANAYGFGMANGARLTAAEFVAVPSSQAVPLPVLLALKPAPVLNSADGCARCHPCQCVR
jgi:NADPH:quinone reductase-like Zn-dependent oxidoreductase